MDKLISTIKGSSLLDQKWYLSEYPDVVALNMDPAVHYVQLGALLHRDPGPDFSTKVYLAENPDVAKAGINPLYHYIVWGEDEGREISEAKSRLAGLGDRNRTQADIENIVKDVESAISLSSDKSAVNAIELPDWHGSRAFLLRPSDTLLPFSVEDLEVKLWGGYSSYALDKLNELKYNPATSLADRVNIGWHLFRWYAVEGQGNKALENLRLSKYYCSRMGPRANNARRKIAVAEAQCLARANQIVKARKVLDSAIKRLGKNPNFWLAQAAVAGNGGTLDHSSMTDRDAPLSWINRLYIISGLALLRKEREDEPLSFFNVTAEEVPVKPIAECKEKISIVIPAYNAEGTIHISISSLLKQTWSNLEIVVVDDCSTDTTANIVEKFASQDGRVKLIRKEVNGGAYPARNLGLLHVTGDLVLVHDSDDWSHPQKIELQMAELTAHPEAVAVMSHWVRFDENLRPVGPWRPTGNYFDLNFSSLMTRRHVMESMGGWDEVRISGDAEYRFRIIRKYGRESVLKVSSQHLLSLSLTREDSLTQTKATHLRSLDFGLRWLYRDAYQYWHTSEEFLSRPRIDKDRPRPFPAPYMLRSRSTEQLQYDVIFISDLSYRPYAEELLRYIRPAVEAGRSIGLVHWPRYDRYVHLPIFGPIYDVCTNHQVSIITHGESAATKLVVLLHPEIAQYKLDQFPEIAADNVLLVAREFPVRPIADVEAHQVLNIIQSHVSLLFDKPGVWQAGSTAIKRSLIASAQVEYVAKELWLPRISPVGKKAIYRLPLSAHSSELPVIGRCSNSVIGLDWPNTFKDVKKAYCADSDIKVVMRCDEDIICSNFGRHPNNWIFSQPEDESVEDFLSRIDFYIYYPDAGYVGMFDEALWGAMARGIPVVMPRKYNHIFGDAAIYSNADSVEESIDFYWRKLDRYESMSNAARDFIRLNCSLKGTLSRMIETAKSSKSKSISI